MTMYNHNSSDCYTNDKPLPKLGYKNRYVGIKGSNGVL